MKNKYIKLIIIAYIAINILGVIVYYALPKVSFAQAKPGVKLEQSLNMEEEIMNNPRVLEEKILEDKYNIKNYNFNYEGKDLEILFEKEEQQIFIDRKTVDDNKIEIYWYSGPMLVNGIDFAYMVKGPDIELNDNNLNIRFEKQSYSFTQFSKDLGMNQFYSNKDDENKGINGRFGSSVIYIKIPQNLKVLGDESYHYINN
ncbi:hypothetical protein [Clostridium sp.]|uniref:hypothetical protein n=1 Tax=Clostridium sp. TaxID=1506 RepID=UPI002FC8A21C